MVDNPYDEYQLNDDLDDDIEDADIISDEPEPSSKTKSSESSEGGQPPTEDTGEPNPEKPKRGPLRKLIVYAIIILIVIGAVFAGYKQFPVLITKAKQLIKKEMPSKAKPIPVVKPKPVIMPVKLTAPPSTAVQILPKAPPSIKKPTTAKVVSAALPKEVSTISKQIDDIQKENEKLITSFRSQRFESQMHVNALAQRVSSLKGGLTNLKGSVNSLHDVIKKLTRQLNEQKRLQSILSTYRKTAKQRQQKQIRYRKRYFVKAVIPGRAWLYAADGTSITVTVGDSVPGYGKVIGIDPFSGVVSTSSGIKVHYGVSSE